MQSFQGQRRVRAFFASRAVLAVLFLLLIGMGVASFRALVAGSAVEEQYIQLEEEITGVEEKKEALVKELEELRNGEGIEREAREKLNLRKPGEKVVIILDEADPVPIHQSEQNAGFLSRLLQWLKNYAK
jgi:cell division protein FtsB